MQSKNTIRINTKSNENQLVSIIIPVYNSEKYLNGLFACINNLLYKNYELVFIDDGSKDKSPQMLDDYCKNNTRARVYHIQNHGPSFARNYGIKATKGEFIYFWDSDDFVHPAILNVLLNNINKTNSDVSICSWCLMGKNKKYKYKQNIKIPKCGYKTYKGFKNIMCMFFAKLNSWGVLWTKLYRRSVFKKNKSYPNVCPTDICVCEDQIINLEYFLNCKKIVFTRKQLYHYRVHNDSTYHSISRKKIASECKWIDMLYNYDFGKEKVVKKYATAGCSLHACDVLFKVVNSKTKVLDDVNHLYSIYKKSIRAMLTCFKYPLYMSLGFPITHLILSVLLHLKGKLKK